MQYEFFKSTVITLHPLLLYVKLFIDILFSNYYTKFVQNCFYLINVQIYLHIEVFVMISTKVNALKPGMVLASDVLTASGQRLFDKGTTLTLQSIMRLSFYRIDSVLVEGTAPAPPEHAPLQTEAEDANLAPVYTQKIESSRQFQSFQIDHSFVISSIMNSFDAFVKHGIPLPADMLLDSISQLFDACKTSRELFDMLHNMRSSGESIYFHSLNVALLCRQIGTWLKVNDNELDLLTQCGLFHDIGKLMIPEEILNKPGKYTEEEFALVKMHPEYGYKLLRDTTLNIHIKKSALSHHERCDGSGYPIGLSQEDTDEYAMIVAIADVYDAMTAARSYRSPLCPFQVIANFEQEGLQKYKPKYILTFLSRIANIYQNNRVILNDGRGANIVMLNTKALSRPIVQLDDGNCIDLSTTPGLQIQTVL